MATPRRHGRPQVDPELRESAVHRLGGLRERGEFWSEQVRLVADQLQVSERTVWRWLRLACTEGRSARAPMPGLEVSEQDVVDLAYHRGSVAAFHRARTKAGPTPGVGAWRRAFRRALSPGRRAGIAEGERARRDFDTYLTGHARFRNQCWQADHTELAIRVLLPDRRVVSPWATLFLDVYSRAFTGFAISVTPSRESILAALRSAIMVEPPYGPMGGVPGALRVDRGRDFLADAIGAAAAALAIEVRALPGYTPHRKGAIERANGSVEQLLLIDLPGFLHGGRDLAGHLVDADAPLLSLERFIELFADFVRWYNTERPHEGLGGRTPLEQWNGDPTPVHTIPAARLRHLMLVGVTRTVSKKGVRLNGLVYNCAELCGQVGETVEVRYMPHHDHEVELFRDGHHLGTAELVERMSPSEATRLLERRAEEAQWLSRVTRAAAKQRRVVYAAMTEPGPVVPVSAITGDATAAEASGYADVQQRRLASRSLARPAPIPERMVHPVVLSRDAS